MGKELGSRAEECYEEYMILKHKISELSYYRDISQSDREELDSKIERFRYVVKEMEYEGIDLADLLLKNAGFYVDILGTDKYLWVLEMLRTEIVRCEHSYDVEIKEEEY